MDRTGIQKNPSSGHAESSGSRDGAAVGAAVDPRFDRSVAFWLRAYPRRWRVQRAGEMTAVLADIAGPRARRLDAAAAWGLLRGGWATRWREHPPLDGWLEYRLLARPLPPQHWCWTRDDIEAFWYPLRLQCVLVVSMVMSQYFGAQNPSLPARAAFVCVGIITGGIVVAGWRRVRHLARVRYLGAGYAREHRVRACPTTR
jgi:hypothetical protein